MTLQSKLQEIRDRVGKASKGPWRKNGTWIDANGMAIAEIVYMDDDDESEANHNLFVHSRTDIELLLQIAEVAMGALDNCGHCDCVQGETDIAVIRVAKSAIAKLLGGG